MTKKWIAINLLLLAVTGTLGWQFNQSVARYRKENAIANLRAQPVGKKAAPESDLPPARVEQKINETEFAVIPAQNPFAEIRRLEEKVDATPAPEPPRKLDYIPILLGVTISSTQQMALIRDPAAGNTPGAKTIKTIRLGDNYRGFVVTDITDKSLVLEYGPSREVIPLYDTSKPPAQAGKTPILASRVVNIGPGAAGAAGVAGNTVMTAASPAGRPQAAPTAPPAGGRAVPAANPRVSGQSSNSPQMVAPGSVISVSPGPTWNSTIDSQGRTIVNSPFGQFALPPNQQQQPPIKK